MEEVLDSHFKVWKQEHEVFYDKLDQEDQLKVIRKEALALGIIKHDELQAPVAKKPKPSRSSSVISIHKRGCLVSQLEDINHNNLVAHTSTPTQKDGSVTPTKASVAEHALSPKQKEPPASGMDVDVPSSPLPQTISSDIIPPPPVQAELTPAVKSEELLCSSKSPSPAQSDDPFLVKVEENFIEINQVLGMILNCLGQLEAWEHPISTPMLP